MNMRQRRQPSYRGTSWLVNQYASPGTARASAVTLLILLQAAVAQAQEGGHFDAQSQAVVVEGHDQNINMGFNENIRGLLERNKEFQHNQDGSNLRAQTELRLIDKQKMIREMDLEVMILIGTIAFLGLILLVVIFFLCLYFYKERKESKQEMLELESASVSYASRTHYSQMPMYQFNDGYNTTQTSQRTYYNTESTYQNTEVQNEYGGNHQMVDQQRRRRKRSKHGSQGGGGSSHRARNRDVYGGNHLYVNQQEGYNNYYRQEHRNQSPSKGGNDQNQNNNYDNGGYPGRRHGSSEELSAPNRSLNHSGTMSSGQNSQGQQQPIYDSSQSMNNFQRRQGFGVIKEENGETSMASDSLPGDKSFQNKFTGHDNIKDMMFDSQVGDEEYQDDHRQDRRRLIDRNAPQSHNYHDRHGAQRQYRPRK